MSIYVMASAGIGWAGEGMVFGFDVAVKAALFLLLSFAIHILLGAGVSWPAPHSGTPACSGSLFSRSSRQQGLDCGSMAWIGSAERCRGLRTRPQDWIISIRTNARLVVTTQTRRKLMTRTVRASRTQESRAGPVRPVRRSAEPIWHSRRDVPPLESRGIPKVLPTLAPDISAARRG